MSSQNEALPLDGITVIDFTHHAAGPCCTMMLGDFGADVIKVEPTEGDYSRKWGSKQFGPNEEFSGLFLAVNRNKESIALDLKSPEGRAVIRRLMARADVIVENFRPGVADRLGVGYGAARELREDIVYCSISGFGQTGPMSHRPGLDNFIQAHVGQMSVTGEPGGPSIRIGLSPNDFLAAAHGALGIMMALFERTRSGKGQSVDVSLYDSGIQLVGHFMADYTGTGSVPQKAGSHFQFLAPYGAFQAKDREFFMGSGTDTMFERLCGTIERLDLVSDPRFATNGARLANADELYDLLGAAFATRNAEDWVEDLLNVGITSSLINTIDEVVDQPQAHVRNMVVPTGLDGIKTAGIPIKLSRTPGSIRKNAPGLNQHVDSYL